MTQTISSIKNTLTLIFSFLLMLTISSSCNKDSAVDCDTDMTVGPYFLLEESLNSFSIYDNYNTVSFVNQEDTMKFNIGLTPADIPIDRHCIVTCNFDENQTTNYTYGSDQKTINLQRANITDPNAINLMTLTLSSKLHLNIPELGLIGDFLSIWTSKSGADQSIEIETTLDFPVNLRNYPTPFEELNGFEYFESLILNEVEYLEVFKSHPSLESEITVWWTNTQGIIAYQDVNNQVWHLTGYE